MQKLRVHPLFPRAVTDSVNAIVQISWIFTEPQSGRDVNA